MEQLKKNTYPGRGILIGKSEDGKNAVIGYFIMGRSVNSRNRIFTADGDGLRTEAKDPALLTDPSLIIYHPVRVLNDVTVVTNGDQTDTIYDFLKKGKTFEAALDTREFEPDRPNYTPRISGMVNVDDGDFTFKMSILKANGEEDPWCNRYYFEYSHVAAGKGKIIHTYVGDGNPIPSYVGEPRDVAVKGGIDEFADVLWNSLNADNKVALFVRYINLETRAYDTRIINR